MRYLFVVPPLAGRAYAAVAVDQALRARGHEVAWAGSESYLRPLLGPDAVVYPTGMRPYRGQLDTGTAALKSLWANFVVPFAKFTLPAVDDAACDFRPDVLVVDQHAIAGALVAHRYGRRWASLLPQSMELTRPLRGLPTVEEWIRGLLVGLWRHAGLEAEFQDPRFSPHLVLAFTTTALTGGSFPEHYALVGPALGQRPPSEHLALDPTRRHVLITMGTLANDVARDFYAKAVEALRPLGDRLQAVVVAPAEAVPDPPAHVLVVPRVAVLDLLPHLDAVVCHGGLNTVCESLAYGVPLVVAPIKHDQPVNAAQVAAAGAGIRIRFPRVRPDQLRAAILAVLDDPGYRGAAARVRDSFTAAGGAAAAADRLVALASTVDIGSTP
jgi:UDP:flavonoid glycosyltransferase YjiC (YdhE family)